MFLRLKTPTRALHGSHIKPVDLAGLTTGVVALAGMFNNAVDCFEYIQFGRYFVKDLRVNLLKLDNAGLRLSRWGESMGLSRDLEGAQALSAEDARRAGKRLGQTSELFANAEGGVSAKFKNRTNAEPLEYDAGVESDSVITSLRH